MAGIRTPEHIDDLQRRMPEIYDELLAIAGRLERHYKDMQDIEFTIQEGKLYLLQTRGRASARRAAAVRVAVDLVHESVIDQHTALLRVRPAGPRTRLLRPGFDAGEQGAGRHGRDACWPAGCPRRRARPSGRSCSTPTARWSGPRNGRQVILVRPETSPEDVAGMYAAEGIVTARGGRTSHAAVVAVGMGKPCVVGAGDDRRRRGPADLRGGRPDGARG